MINTRSLNKRNPHTYYIYIIENPMGWIYIGNTMDFELRKTKYRNYKNTRTNKGLELSFDLFTFEAHTFRVFETIHGENLLETCKEAYRREKIHIRDHYNKMDKRIMNIDISGWEGQRDIRNFDIDLKSRFMNDYTNWKKEQIKINTIQNGTN